MFRFLYFILGGVGTFEDKRKNRRREEWPTSNAAAMKVCGIGSKTSFNTALWDARGGGYIILRELDDPAERKALSTMMGHICKFTLKIRYMDEPVDYPALPYGMGPRYSPYRRQLSHDS